MNEKLLKFKKSVYGTTTWAKMFKLSSKAGAAAGDVYKYEHMRG